MITLKIENPDIEKIFLEGFSSNKDKFLAFVQESYQKMKLLESFDTSLKQAKLQENGEIGDLSLDELIDELKNSTNA